MSRRLRTKDQLKPEDKEFVRRAVESFVARVSHASAVPPARTAADPAGAAAPARRSALISAGSWLTGWTAHLGVGWPAVRRRFAPPLFVALAIAPAACGKLQGFGGPSPPVVSFDVTFSGDLTPLFPPGITNVQALSVALV
jgi:hypothetical protein